jgi:transglutaminase-like putative cysteine protease
MSTSALTPWPRSRHRAALRRDPRVAGGSVRTTSILDHLSPTVAGFAAQVQDPDPTDRSFVQAAHRLITFEIAPVYALDDRQPASVTITRGRGSCSQRLAVLEAVARSHGIPTRVRGLFVDGSFWYPRFPRLRPLVPKIVVLAWPEFLLDGDWVGAGELFGPLTVLPAGPTGFTNADGETLFGAIARSAVDWDGVTSAPGTRSSCDLSAVVGGDAGHFSDRDALFDAAGQTLCRPSLMIGDPIMRRRRVDGGGVHA